MPLKTVAADQALEFKHIIVFTDGACSGNPGPGGWGAVVVTPEGHVTELGGSVESTTNNRMELAAAIFALKFLSKDLRPIALYTDSTYLIRGITQWLWGWKKKGWKTAENDPVQNQDQWQELEKLITARGKKGQVSWHYSRGHMGTPGNERCDSIAVSMSQGKWMELYNGPLLGYDIPIYDVPEDTTLPEMRPNEEKKPAFSYLSYLGGQVCRHKDWASCERRVKGQSGAKFKKAMTAQDEIKILSEWNLPPTTPIKE
jgi:ribonuclease HI